MLNLLVLPLVLRRGLGLGRGLAGELEALLDGAEELRAGVVDVLERGDDVGGRGDGLEQLYALQGVGDLLDTLKAVAVAEQDLKWGDVVQGFVYFKAI